ncbi:transcription factor Opi1-domain-containing protein [Fomitopsis serialis]|uniref:transcription factor Opi1-domain-containing protein n=1 Tax=Fomitopsis serialis TaxID=139415 RepID=UPI002008D2D1|nr:transcription factor Opi1-domain-containing protein [Neoantrodia serialis]KAH9933440.1 transcription factor Opi1-domain-containing protein [Neoantrodia serialis]
MALDEDESVRIAVRALGDMKNGGFASTSTSVQPTPALSVTSGTSSPSLPSPVFEGEDRMLGSMSAGSEDRLGLRPGDDVDFVSRMSSLPIVNTALRAYEQGKASSRVVKYGAEMMESSVKSISRPVMGRLPVEQLDDFACRQLDRFESYRRRTPSRDREGERGRRSSFSYDDSNPSRSVERYATRDVSMIRELSRERSGTNERQAEAGPSFSRAIPRRGQSHTPTPHSPSSSRSSHTDADDDTSRHQHQRQRGSISATPSPTTESQQVAQRSRWQAMLLEAGGISAAFSEDSMRRLRYCLQWLQYATGHIDAQMLVLRDFIASLQTTSPSAAAAAISAQHLRTLNAAKRDVVETIRQVVDIVSRYAGGALPEPARTRVRTFILRLPRRWAEASGDTHHHGHGVDGRPNGGADRVDMRRSTNVAPYSYGPGEAGPSPRSRPPSRATSPGHTRAHSRQASATMGATPGGAPTTVDSANQAAQRILTLATESLDMLRGVTAVVSESLERADAWVERLRVVGLQRPNGETSPGANLDAPPDIDAVLDPRLRGEAYRDQRSHRQPYSHSPSSPLSPYAPLSPLSASGRSTPAYVPSRNNSSSVLSMGPPGSLSSSYYSTTSLDAGGAAVSLDALSLTSHSAASSRYATPKHSHSALPSEGDGDSPVYMSRKRAGKRPADSSGDDPTVVAATALAGLAGSAKRAKQEPNTDEKMDMEP